MCEAGRGGGEEAPCAVGLPDRGSEQFGVRNAEWGVGRERARRAARGGKGSTLKAIGHVQLLVGVAVVPERGGGG
jgi:hypothetical protein